MASLLAYVQLFFLFVKSLFLSAFGRKTQAEVGKAGAQQEIDEKRPLDDAPSLHPAYQHAAAAPVEVGEDPIEEPEQDISNLVPSSPAVKESQDCSPSNYIRYTRKQLLEFKPVSFSRKYNLADLVDRHFFRNAWMCTLVFLLSC